MTSYPPPTPTEAARVSLAQGAKDVARHAFMRRVHTFARSKLPRPVYNLILGGKSAAEVAEDEARRRLRNLLWGCGFSLTFGCLVGVVLLLVAAVIAGAVVFG